MQALRQELLPPSGVEFATCLKLLPSTLSDSKRPGTTANTGRALFNVVVARSNFLRIYEVKEEPAPISSQRDDERERRASVRKGTEAVEGEVEMDASGEGFVNMGSVKTTGQNGVAQPQTVVRFYLVREHRLHGIVTGIEPVRIVTSIEDNLDRLVVSFKDAKIALLEWSDAIYDLITVSIHTYERAPQIFAIDAPLFHSELRTDPLSRCAALLLPKDSIAILPFYQSQAELDIMEQETSQAREIPYSPSFILDLSAGVDDRMRNVIDFVFLPGFNNPTVAVLYQHTQTWTGRLQEYKDTVGLIIFTLDLVTRHYPVITVVESLPYDCFALTACSTSLGGVVVLASNSILYVDQVSRRVTLPVNGWPPRTSDMPMPTLMPDEQKRDLRLEGAQFTFVDERTLYVFARDGTVYPVEIVLDGKTVSRLAMAAPVARTTIPALVERVGEEYLFVGSIVGPSVLLKTTRVEADIVDEDVEMAAALATVVAPTNSMDLDEDEELYGTSAAVEQPHSNGNASGVASITKKRTVVHLSLCDAIPAYGPIADMAFSLARNGDRAVPELVAATGSGALGGFTLLQRDLPIRTKRKIHAIGGARGIWSLSVRQAVKVNGSTFERPSNPFHTETDTLIISTDATPSPGTSRIASRNAQGEIQIPTRILGTTIGAAPFFQGTAILHVVFNVTNVIRVLEPDGTERQSIKDTDGNLPRPRARFCSICDPFILIIREDDSIGLFIGELERGKIRRKDMSPMGEKTSKYLAGCFFTDTSGVFQAYQSAEAAGTEGVTSTLQAAMNSGSKSQWLVLARPQGVVEIWTLPKLNLVFSTTLAATLEPVLNDSLEPVSLSLPQDPPRKPQELDIEQIIIAPLGESSPRPHLMVFLRSGLLAVYEAITAPPPDDILPNSRTATLLVKFVKVASRAFNIQVPEEQEKSVLAEVKKISRYLIPFVSSPTPGQTLSGVFFTGDRPCWVLSTDKGGVKVFPSGHSVVHAFTATSAWESRGDFLLYSEEGPSLVEWVSDLQLDTHLPSRFVSRPRSYTNVVYDPNTSLIVAASSRQSRFASYDDDGNIMWEPDAPNISFSYCDCSTLEVLMPDSWITMDGYEFAQNEFVTCLDCVTLESVSTETGTKDFIAVGTTINRGEDLAVKGAVYIFEIVEVVPDVNTGWKRWHQLKLRCRDDAKGPVTALCGMDGYLVSSMGQKIFVRAFDLDERLVGVAFLDVGVYVTSLRAVKNLLLIGDAVKSVWFVAFQEDPYKLVILGKDPHHVCVTNADLFFAENRVSIMACDEDGVIRLYEYDPHDPESRGGQHLLPRTEFHGQTEYRTSALIARRKLKDTDIPQSKLICGATDGSLSSFTYVDESAFKRLHLLQGQLTRNVQHVAGLNPRAFRIVRNDYVSKPLSKGILDGNLFATFEDLPIPRQNEVTQQIGTERSTVLKDWLSLNGAW